MTTPVQNLKPAERLLLNWRIVERGQEAFIEVTFCQSRLMSINFYVLLSPTGCQLAKRTKGKTHFHVSCQSADTPAKRSNYIYAHTSGP